MSRAGLPLPVGFGPQRPILISARPHELQVLTVGHHVFVDGERGHVDGVCVSNSLSQPKLPEARTGRALPVRRGCRSFWRWPPTARASGLDVLRRRNLAVDRQLMEHVRKRFRVHEPVLNGHVQTTSAKSSGPSWCHRSASPASRVCRTRLAYAAHFGRRRPVGGLIGRQSSAHRIDAKGKQSIELRIRGLESGRCSCSRFQSNASRCPK